MVGSSVDGAEAVEACRDALVDGRGHDSVAVSSTVHTLELTNWSEGVGWCGLCETYECKGQGVKGFGGIRRRHGLDHDMGVPDDSALAIDLLGSSVVVADKQ